MIITEHMNIYYEGTPITILTAAVVTATIIITTKKRWQTNCLGCLHFNVSIHFHFDFFFILHIPINLHNWCMIIWRRGNFCILFIKGYINIYISGMK